MPWMRSSAARNWPRVIRARGPRRTSPAGSTFVLWVQRRAEFDQDQGDVALPARAERPSASKPRGTASDVDVTVASVSVATSSTTVPRAARMERAIDALRLAGLEHHAFSPARVLSGGEQQRLCLARALSLGPDVVFLDEPTASLDPASTASIERLLDEMQHRGTKLIMVTHDVGQARRLAREIVFLNRGRLAEQQPASAFFTPPRIESEHAFLTVENPN